MFNFNSTAKETMSKFGLQKEHLSPEEK